MGSVFRRRKSKVFPIFATEQQHSTFSVENEKTLHDLVDPFIIASNSTWILPDFLQQWADFLE
jgi:hypothetical protein